MVGQCRFMLAGGVEYNHWGLCWLTDVDRLSLGLEIIGQ
jgi:hypothetical protein